MTVRGRASPTSREFSNSRTLGDEPDPERSDLAIEVVWTRGAIDKLEVYRMLGVRELWTSKAGGLELYSLHGEDYVRVERSVLLPELDLAELLRFIDVKPMTRAVREYREKLRARGELER